jgi:hypothetical protein
VAREQVLSTSISISLFHSTAKQVLVANMLSCKGLNISFRKTLSDHKWRLWLELVQWLMSVQLTTKNTILCGV